MRFSVFKFSIRNLKFGVYTFFCNLQLLHYILFSVNRPLMTSHKWNGGETIHFKLWNEKHEMGYDIKKCATSFFFDPP